MAAKQKGTGKYQNYQLSEDINDELFDTSRRVTRIKNLLIDEATRVAIELFERRASRLAVLKDATVDGPEALLMAAVRDYERAVEGVAARLRGIYDGSVTTS